LVTLYLFPTLCGSNFPADSLVRGARAYTVLPPATTGKQTNARRRAIIRRGLLARSVTLHSPGQNIGAGDGSQAHEASFSNRVATIRHNEHRYYPAQHRTARGLSRVCWYRAGKLRCAANSPTVITRGPGSGAVINIGVRGPSEYALSLGFQIERSGRELFRIHRAPNQVWVWEVVMEQTASMVISPAAVVVIPVDRARAKRQKLGASNFRCRACSGQQPIRDRRLRDAAQILRIHRISMRLPRITKTDPNCAMAYGNRDEAGVAELVRRFAPAHQLCLKGLDAHVESPRLSAQTRSGERGRRRGKGAVLFRKWETVDYATECMAYEKHGARSPSLAGKIRGRRLLLHSRSYEA